MEIGNSRRGHVLILGAGPTGLFAAKTLVEGGARVTIAEQEPVVGGLAASKVVNGNFYEFGVHHLHAFDEFIFREVERLMGSRLHPVEKSALIRYGKGFCRYPLEFADILKAMPLRTFLRCCLGLAFQQARNRIRPRAARDGEEALLQLYGRPLYEVFFRDFTHRYWGIPPSDLSPVFIQKKMPRLSAFDAVKKILSKVGVRDRRKLGTESALSSETLYYPRTGAHEIYDALAERLRAQGADLRLSSPVERLEVEGSRISRAVLGGPGGGTAGDLSFVISSIPLPSLIRAFGEAAPPEIKEAADSLRYKPQAVLGLLVKKERVLDALYVYFRDRIFHRVGEPKLSGLEVTPPGHTILIVELTEAVLPDDGKRQEELFLETCRDLAKDDLIQGPQDVAERHFFYHRYAYPVYLQNFDGKLELIRGFLARFEGLISTGRQGGFAYPNMHQAMRMGHEAALKALAAE